MVKVVICSSSRSSFILGPVMADSFPDPAVSLLPSQPSRTLLLRHFFLWKNTWAQKETIKLNIDTELKLNSYLLAVYVILHLQFCL